MKRVKGVENLNIGMIRTQGIVGVGAIIRISIASCRLGASLLDARAGFTRKAPASSCRYTCSATSSGESSRTV